MTCQELQCYLENPLRIDVYMYRETLPAAVSEHLDQCVDCARLFEEQKALGINLSLARDAAPQPSSSLDAAVLANYRRYLADPKSVSVPRQGRWNFGAPAFRWGVATAALMAIAALLLLTNRHEIPTEARIEQPAKVVSPAPVSRQQASSVPKQLTTPQARKETLARSASRTGTSSLPPGFASLMYCDEMSCTGAMDVIRVELPSTASGQASGPEGQPAVAEVLVGADGIARGIRIVR